MNSNISIVRNEGTLNDRILNSNLNNIDRIKFTQQLHAVPQNLIDKINREYYESFKETESDETIIDG